MNDRSYLQLIRDRGFGWMLVTQFLGALNDNVYRFIVTFYIIAQRPDEAELYTAYIAALFVLPYLMFSGYAGQLADNFSKRRVLIASKSVEILAMVIGLAAFLIGSIPLMLAVMFLMATHSAFFSPAKYSCLPELLPVQDLSRGNALIEMSTFLAIIIGTAGGGALFQFFGTHPWSLGGVTIGIAVVGTLASFGIGRTPLPRHRKPFRLNPLTDSIVAIREVKRNRRLWLTVLGICWFWFLGSLLQISMPVYGKHVLDISESATSWLWVSVAIGIAIGSVAAGRLSGHKVELGLVPIGSVGIGITALFLVTAHSFWGAVACLSLLGFFAGFYSVPLNAMLQQKSDADSRGRVIAANNVLNFLAILLAAGVSAVLGGYAGLRPDQIIFLSGLATFCVTVYLLILLPDFMIRFSLWLITHTIYRIKIVNPDNVPLNGPALLVCNHLSFVDGLLVGASIQRFVRFMVYAPFFKLPLLGWLFKKMRAIPTGGGREAIAAVRRAREELQAGHCVCIFAEGAISRTGNMLPFKRGFEKIVQDLDVPVIPVHLDQVWGSIFSFKDGKFFWKWPKRFFYPVTITFGAPLPATTRAGELRTRLLELGAEAFDHRRTTRDLVPVRVIRTAKRCWFRFCMADSLGRELTFGAMLTASLMLAKWFRRARPEEERIGVLLPASVGGALVNNGLMLAGKTPINLNFTIGVETMDAAIAKSGIRTIVASKAFLAKAKLEARPGTIFVEDMLGGFGKAERALTYMKAMLLPTGLLCRLTVPKGDPFKDLATIMFSSGSTGEPKGVMLSHHNVISNLEAIGQILGATPEDRVMGVLPFFHAFGFTGTLFMPLVLGLGAVYHPNPLDAKSIGGLIRKYKATLLISTPTFCQAYHRVCAPEDLASLRHVVVGAERLRPEFAEQFKEKFGIQLLEGYGATEMGPVVATNVPDVLEGPDRQIGTKPGTVGHPIPGVAAKVVDAETGAPRKEGEEGLLLLKGPGRMVGYLADPDRTLQVLRDEWYVTGDIAIIDEDGFIKITDRLSRFSKVGGEMVPHLKIEEAMLRIPGIGAAAVVAVPDADRGERLFGLYVADETMESQLVWQGLSDSGLPKLWIPKARDLRRIDELPTLGTGKIDIRRLRQTALDLAAEG
ncbi:acyl-[ACP]--phospholipid O-acyltransferase [Dongia sedimenti]|uniref:Acyl-[ACP]--phospholipid O-acyltransferase n=1 Tax=Dongia sedimenti TaxID=3064282 RepID=A0ABU0YHZ4_9PROT|nr:acyl-[ACP]--phospholipid O-acyltransferase [Rhodospirillaceae bacterium R-7]